MNHAEARELLEIAATEPGGLERLMAGDTPDAAALAGHLAGCAGCADELLRLRRASAVIGAVIRSTPSPELRDRTLAYVAALGRDRTRRADLGEEAADGSPAVSSTPAAAARADTRSSRPVAAWLTAVAAVLIAAVAATALLIGGQAQAEAARQAAQLDRRATQVAALERVAGESLRIGAAPDARRVELVPMDGSQAAGTVLFSPGSRDLVVVSTGLTEPGSGRELRCWVEVDGQRRPVGRMFFADRLAFWVGRVDALAGLPDGARFGITLVDAGGPSLNGPPTLAGEL